MPISLKSDCLVGPVTAVSFVGDFLLAGMPMYCLFDYLKLKMNIYLFYDNYLFLK